MGVQAFRAARETVFMKVGVKIGFGSTVLNLGLGSSGINGIGQYTQQFGDSLSGRDDIELVEWFFGDTFKKPRLRKLVRLRGRHLKAYF